MEKLIIEATDLSPKVYFDPDKSIYLIAGESRPKDSEKFYEPVIFWFKSHLSHLQNKKINTFVDIEMHMDYYNLDTARSFVRLFETLENFLSPNISVRVKWFYQANDEDLKGQGQDLSNIASKLPFELICLEEAA